MKRPPAHILVSRSRNEHGPLRAQVAHQTLRLYGTIWRTEAHIHDLDLLLVIIDVPERTAYVIPFDITDIVLDAYRQHLGVVRRPVDAGKVTGDGRGHPCHLSAMSILVTETGSGRGVLPLCDVNARQEVADKIGVANVAARVQDRDRRPSIALDRIPRAYEPRRPEVVLLRQVCQLRRLILLITPHPVEVHAHDAGAGPKLCGEGLERLLVGRVGEVAHRVCRAVVAEPEEVVAPHAAARPHDLVGRELADAPVEADHEHAAGVFLARHGYLVLARPQLGPGPVVLLERRPLVGGVGPLAVGPHEAPRLPGPLLHAARRLPPRARLRDLAARVRRLRRAVCRPLRRARSP